MRIDQRITVAAVLFLLPLAGCDTTPDTASDTGGARDTGAVASVDKGAAADTIRRLDAQWPRWATEKKVDSMLTLYAPDARSLIPGQKLITDNDGRRKAFNEMIAANLRDVKGDTKGVEFSDDGTLAYSYGTYSGTWTTGGRDVKDEGSYLSVWRRTANGWRAVAEASNSSLPMGAPPAETPKR